MENNPANEPLSYQTSKRLLILFITAVAVLYLSTVAVRIYEFKVCWLDDRENYYYENIPLMGGADAYTWLHFVDVYNMNGDVEYDPFANYPDRGVKIKPKFLLSDLIDKFSFFFGGDLYYSGLFLFIFFAGLFIIPLSVYFYKIGYPAAGLMGGFCGAYSTMYVLRANVGRVDTDPLNLFFLYAAALFIMLSMRAKNSRWFFIHTALAGITVNLFIRWYAHSYLTTLFLFTYICCIILERYLKNRLLNRRNIIIGIILFVLFMNPFFLVKGVLHQLRFLDINVITVLYDFPNAYTTISERRGHESFYYFISTTFINAPIFIISIAGFIYFAIKKFRYCVPLLVAVIIAGTSIRFARAVMYLMPLVGVGLGFLVTELIYMVKNVSTVKRILISYLAGALIIAVFLIIPAHRGLLYFYKPSLSISPYIFAEIARLSNLPKNSAVYTWWDYGQVINLVPKLTTYHEGSSQGGVKTWFVAKSLVSPTDKFGNILALVNNHGEQGLHNMMSYLSREQVEDFVNNYSLPVNRPDVYVFFTYDMIEKFAAISGLGSWDIKNSQYTEKPFIYTEWCKGNTGMRAECGEFHIDLVKGLVNRTMPLNRIVLVDPYTGNVYHESATGFKSDLNALMIKDGDTGTNYLVVLVDNRLYESSFVQMFLMGRYDETRFKQVDINFPLSRLYKVLW